MAHVWRHISLTFALPLKSTPIFRGWFQIDSVNQMHAFYTPVYTGSEMVKRWATTWQNQQNGCVPSESLGSAQASTQSDQSLLCPRWTAKDPRFLHADSEDWSDWVHAQLVLSCRGSVASDWCATKFFDWQVLSITAVTGQHSLL